MAEAAVLAVGEQGIAEGRRAVGAEEAVDTEKAVEEVEATEV